MLSTAKINLCKKNNRSIALLLIRQSKRTRNVIKNISGREIYQLVMHENNSSSRHVTKMGGGEGLRGGGGGEGENTL